jgi:hypothetical protein
VKKVINRGIKLCAPDEYYSCGVDSGVPYADHVVIKTSVGWLVVCSVEEVFDMIACTQETIVRPLMRDEIESISLFKKDIEEKQP